MDGIRLQKFLAEAGIGSRRKCEQYILDGRVKVNNETVTGLGVKVYENDIVEFDGKIVKANARKVYIILNKPEGYITTVRDQFGRKSVLDLVKDVKERIYPVGRLDYNTSGLLLLTNDGDFAYRLTHPSGEVEKTYIAEVRGVPSDKVKAMFEQGMVIDGNKTAPASFKILRKGKSTSLVEIRIHEGRNRQVRKMCEKAGHPVIRLKRTAIGKLKLGSLPEGHWRYLTKSELEKIV